MAEARGIHTEKIFGSTSQQGDERKAFANARRAERHMRNFAKVASLGVEKASSKLKQFFHLKPSSNQALKTIPKEIPSSVPLHHDANSIKQHRTFFKKPPFVVPGVIRHNDCHLVQEFPHAKYNKSVPKKTSKPTVKPATHQSGSSKQPATKTPSLPVKRPLKAIAHESRGFVAPPEIRRHIGQFPQITCRKRETQHADTDDEPSSSEKNVVFTPRNRANPFITIKREFSEQKRFSSLVTSDSGSPLRVSSFTYDGFSISSDSEDDFASISKQSISEQQHRNEETHQTEGSGGNLSLSNTTIEVKAHGHTFGTTEAVIEKNRLSEKNDSEEESKNVSLKSDDHHPAAVKQNMVSPSKREAAQYLRDQVDDTRFRLEELCCVWSSILEEGEGNIPQEETGSVITVIRQTEQLQRERFNQYSTLIDQFEDNSGEKLITTTDLEGFWEMILLQVADVEKKFAVLDRLHKNGWMRRDDVEPKEDKDKQPKKKTGRKKSSSLDGNDVKSGIRSHIAALRKKNKCSPAADCVNSSDNQESPSPHEDLKHPPTVSSLKSSVVEGYESPITRPVHLLQSSGSTASSDAKSSSKDSPVVIDKRDTPVCVKILRSKRKKHHSSTVFTSFFPPAQLGSPRPRSRSTESCQQPSVTQSSPSLHKRLGMKDFCKFLTLPFQSPTGRNNNPLEKHVDNTTPQHPDSPVPFKEENNNDPNENCPVQVAVTHYE